MTEQLFEVTALFNSTKRQLLGLRSETSILFGVKKKSSRKNWRNYTKKWVVVAQINLTYTRSLKDSLPSRTLALLKIINLIKVIKIPSVYIFFLNINYHRV